MAAFDRREFFKRTASTAAQSAAVGTLLSTASGAACSKTDEIDWGVLLHLSFNMWEERVITDPSSNDFRCYRPFLRFDEPLWRDLLKQMSDGGMNLLVIDLGDGVRYKSDSSFAVEGAWSVSKLCDELQRVRDHGMEPIPKLNFSTAHDTWMGEYAKMVSTAPYYQVAGDLIAEVTEIFDGPRYFHLGMDEETADHQRTYDYVVIRKRELWWKDLLMLVDAVQQGGSRPWIWSDFIWRHQKDFLQNMPRTVLQSNWYYGTEFPSRKPEYTEAYRVLDENEYDQFPTGSNHSNPENFGLTVDYCQKVVSPQRLKGFLQTPWRPTIDKYRTELEESIRLVAQARSES